MKLISIFVPLAVVTDVSAKGPKTPFRRRLDKTFGLIKEWRAQNLNAHPHSKVKLSEKDNKTKFDHKFDRIQTAVVNQYEEQLAIIKPGIQRFQTSDLTKFFLFEIMDILGSVGVWRDCVR